MTSRKSHGLDNGGRCEGCDDPATIRQPQTTHPVLLGGGIGWGTMWLCPRCKAEREAVRTITVTIRDREARGTSRVVAHDIIRQALKNYGYVSVEIEEKEDPAAVILR